MKVKFTKLYMLTKLGLKNFKVFEKEQELILGKKFTLIYGSNSSGKSSLFQAIQIIKETLNTPDSGFKYLGIQGEMNDFINKNNKSKEKTMNISFEANQPFSSSLRLGGRFGPVGSGLSGIKRLLEKYNGVVYPIKYGVDIIIKLEKDDAKLDKILFKLKFEYDEAAKKDIIYDTNANSVKQKLKNKKLKKKELLILELEQLEKIKKTNIKKHFPNFRGKYNTLSLNNLFIFKVINIIEDDKVWKAWWEFKNKYILDFEKEAHIIQHEKEENDNQIKIKLKKLDKLKAQNKNSLYMKKLENEISMYKRRINHPRFNFRRREFKRTFPGPIVEELKKIKNYSTFKSLMIKDIKNNLKFTSSYLDFSKNIGEYNYSDGYRSLNPTGSSLLEKLSNTFKFGRYWRFQSQLPIINIMNFPSAILSYLHREVFKNIYTVHSTESEFSDSYRMRQENYNTVGRDGKNTPYILIKNKKTLSSVNQILEKAMNIQLSLARGRLQGENHFIFRAKDTYSGKLADTVKMKLAGKGFNSIIPYLTEIMMHENSMILLEEIENSLHPKIISPLIDSLVEIKNNNNYVLETHSKHIVLKLQQLVKNKKLDKEDVAINYIERKQDGSKINNIPLDDNGDFSVSWPEGGFFPEESKIILG